MTDDNPVSHAAADAQPTPEAAAVDAPAVIDLTEAGKEKIAEVFREGKVRIGKVLETMGQERAEQFVEMIESFLASAKTEFQRKE